MMTLNTPLLGWTRVYEPDFEVKCQKGQNFKMTLHCTDTMLY